MTNYYAKKAADRFYNEQRQNRRPGVWRGLTYVTGEQLNAEDEQRRKLEQQQLVNQGNLDAAKIAQQGATTRTGLEQAGMTKRTGMEQEGLMQRQKSDLAYKYDMLDLEREKSDQDFWQQKADRDLKAQQFDRMENRLQSAQDFDQSRGYNLRALQAAAGFKPDELGNMPDPGRFLSFLSEMNNPTKADEMKKLLEALAIQQNTSEIDTQRTEPISLVNTDSVVQTTDGTYTNRPVVTSSIVAPQETSSMSERLRPLRSVLNPLNKTIGGTADSLVNRFQRQNLWTR
jgi:hypothetical protein